MFSALILYAHGSRPARGLNKREEMQMRTSTTTSPFDPQLPDDPERTLNANVGAAAISYLRNGDGIAFGAMATESFLLQVETELAVYGDPTETDRREAVRRVVRDRFLKEVGEWGHDWQFAVISNLLDDVDQEIRDRAGQPYADALKTASSAMEQLRKIVDQRHLGQSDRFDDGCEGAQV